MKKNYNFLLSKISWFGVGGIADIFVVVENENELIEILKEYRNKKKYIIGACSNLLITDNNINGVVIKLGEEFKIKKVINSKQISVKCGESSINTAKFAAENNISKLEFLYTIPGTIGGNIRMNAGCYNSEIKDIIKYIKYIDFDGNIFEININNENIDTIFEYRHCKLPENLIFIEVIFEGKIAIQDEINNKMKEMLNKRNQSQPMGMKTCGSTFMNPTDSHMKAWQLIDAVGLKGYNIGGAKFSDKHSNFIINTGNATTQNIEDLINLAKNKIKQQFNINLEVEIKNI